MKECVDSLIEAACISHRVSNQLTKYFGTYSRVTLLFYKID